MSIRLCNRLHPCGSYILPAANRPHRTKSSRARREPRRVARDDKRWLWRRAVTPPVTDSNNAGRSTTEPIRQDIARTRNRRRARLCDRLQPATRSTLRAVASGERPAASRSQQKLVLRLRARDRTRGWIHTRISCHAAECCTSIATLNQIVGSADAARCGMFRVAEPGVRAAMDEDRRPQSDRAHARMPARSTRGSVGRYTHAGP
jgi:hypothetical protein